MQWLCCADYCVLQKVTIIAVVVWLAVALSGCTNVIGSAREAVSDEWRQLIDDDDETDYKGVIISCESNVRIF